MKHRREDCIRIIGNPEVMKVSEKSVNVNYFGESSVSLAPYHRFGSNFATASQLHFIRTIRQSEASAS